MSLLQLIQCLTVAYLLQTGLIVEVFQTTHGKPNTVDVVKRFLGLGVFQRGDCQFENPKPVLGLYPTNVKCPQNYHGDCRDILESPASINTPNGFYGLEPDSGEPPIFAYCDMEAGGWTVIQQRVRGSIDFERRNFNEYKLGFGIKYGSKDFWIGLDNIYRLTDAVNSGSPYTLRIELDYSTGKTWLAEYSDFKILDENTKYKLVIGTYNGTAGDAMGSQNGTEFSVGSYDHARTLYDTCDVTHRSGGWWFTNNCNHANLNGEYRPEYNNLGIVWDTLINTGPISQVRMMIRRKEK
ncbi:fibrinogen-like protein A [Argopecten irradians]|uniref:fibrinogen-like protein A n=1 Tax=Argopecten irradians TaxID=31199 RepID=UPI00371174DA